MGLPSAEIMAGYGPADGPGGASQRGFALYWIGQIAPILSNGRPVLLEHQCRIAFIQGALKLHAVSEARIILVECDDGTRDARLVFERDSPLLANEQMRNWSLYLHGEAMDAGYEILDTGDTPLAQSVARIVSYLARPPAVKRTSPLDPD